MLDKHVLLIYTEKKIIQEAADLKKKQLIILLAVLAALAICAGAVFMIIKTKDKPNKPDSTPTISVGTVSAKPGDKIQVPVKYTGNPGTMGILFEIEYDGKALEYIGSDRGNIISDCEVSGADGKLSLIAVANEDTDKDGTLVYLNFNVNENASGETEIKLNLGENAVCNYDEKVISVTARNGKITIE